MLARKDLLSLSVKLGKNLFLSHVEPNIIPKVMAINAQLYDDRRILSLLNALYEYSKHTLEHLLHTQLTACYLCMEDHLDQETTDIILISALLHDVGKLLVPSTILSKTSSLSNSEWQIMKTHPQSSVKLLRPLDLSEIILAMVQYHHIRYNGNGYPAFYNFTPGRDLFGCEKLWTSLSYLVMADAFDSMYHERSYRPTYNVSQIYSEISGCVSEHFAPRPAAIMLNVLSNLSVRGKVALC